MKRSACLIVAAAGLLMSTGCSQTRIARVSLPPPAACLERCVIPDPPPRTDVQGERNDWEHVTLERFGACVALHDDCAATALRRLKQDDRQ